MNTVYVLSCSCIVTATALPKFNTLLSPCNDGHMPLCASLSLSPRIIKTSLQEVTDTNVMPLVHYTLLNQQTSTYVEVLQAVVNCGQLMSWSPTIGPQIVAIRPNNRSNFFPVGRRRINKNGALKIWVDVIEKDVTGRIFVGRVVSSTLQMHRCT